MKTFNIKFRTDKIDSEELRECIEDNLGVEILEIDELKQDGTDPCLREKLLDVLKGEDEAVTQEDIFDMMKGNYYTEEEFEITLTKLLEEGFIYQPSPNKFLILE